MSETNPFERERQVQYQTIMDVLSSKRFKKHLKKEFPSDRVIKNVLIEVCQKLQDQNERIPLHFQVLNHFEDFLKLKWLDLIPKESEIEEILPKEKPTKGMGKPW